MKKKLLIVDAHALIHRGFHALPPLTTRSGQHINALYGYLLILIRALKDIKPAYVIIAFDSKGKTFRHDLYKKYKANRSVTPDELMSQFPLVQDMMRAFGFPVFSVKGFEADDIIGTLCEQFENNGDIETIILTGDMDLLQLVDDNTKVLRIQKGIKETQLYDEKLVQEKHGLTPEQIIDYKALRGDASDNIPGVKGIGEKGALTLLQKYTTLQNVFDHLDEIEGRTHTALSEHKEEAFLSQTLATIATDAPIEFNLENARVGKYDQEKITELLQHYEFKSLVLQLPSLPGYALETGLFAPKKEKSKTGDAKQTEQEQPQETPAQKHPDFDYQLVNSPEAIKDLAQKLSQVSIFAFDTETTGLNPMSDDLIGMSFSWKAKEGYYLPCEKSIPKEISAILENPKIKKTGHNLKFDIEVLHRAGTRVQGIAFDSMLASYILNSGSRGHGLDYLAFLEFGHKMQPIEDLIGKSGKGKVQLSMKDVDVHTVSWYACEDADFTWRLYQQFLPLIQKNGFEKLLNDIELPTIEVLAEVEENGVKIDVDFLNDMSKKLHKRITILEKNIQTQAGMEFNVSSNVQLKQVLFEHLQISTKDVKKTKTGFSTAASELEKLRGVHPIIDMISEHRELCKLTSTYIDALPELVNTETGRIHTSFNQTIAATGRLSSTNPNLQNIPIRTELGREIRKAFIPEKGKTLLSLDYSQIELRIVASLAKDNIMLKAFQNGEDIHTRTAAELNDVSLEQVTSDMRRAAKAINFGILYGMGVQGIMRDSGISRDEARLFLDKYFAIHTGIHAYIEKIKSETEEKGYAETIFGRRRALPDIRSSNRMLKAAAERAAVNMPVQGTAADIMKLAMIKVQDAITAKKITADMILQVHDELVFEIDHNIITTEAKKIQQIMEHTYTLDVPLTVSVNAGKNWGELEALF